MKSEFIVSTGLGLWVDGKETYNNNGIILFKKDHSRVAEYVAAKIKGAPLEGDEAVVFKDKEATNIRPENIQIAKKHPKETPQSFTHRINKLNKHRTRKSKMRHSILDLHTRELQSPWPLWRQIQVVQYRLDQMWTFTLKIYGFISDKNLKKIALSFCIGKCKDVQITDLILKEPPRR